MNPPSSFLTLPTPPSVRERVASAEDGCARDPVQPPLGILISGLDGSRPWETVEQMGPPYRHPVSSSNQLCVLRSTSQKAEYGIRNLLLCPELEGLSVKLPSYF